MSNKLYAIGELLIDFQSEGTRGLKETERFVKKAGGAPANVAAQAAKLGAKTVYLTKVGDDGFGEFLIDSIAKIGVDVSYVKKDPKRHTSLAFVSLKEDGEREFSFYRVEAADLGIEPSDFLEVRFEKGDVLAFGTVALASVSARATHDSLIERAREAKAVIAFDPNLRFNLWDDKEELRKTALEYAKKADIVKIGLDELGFVTSSPGEEGVKALFEGGPLKLLLLTDGSRGAKLFTKDRCYHCPGYRVKAVDATGAGDSFFGAFLGTLLNEGKPLEELPYQAMLQFACKAGAYTTTDYGAIPAMGNAEQIERKVH